jgi:hypothetical protein
MTEVEARDDDVSMLGQWRQMGQVAESWALCREPLAARHLQRDALVITHVAHIVAAHRTDGGTVAGRPLVERWRVWCLKRHKEVGTLWGHHHLLQPTVQERCEIAAVACVGIGPQRPRIWHFRDQIAWGELAHDMLPFWVCIHKDPWKRVAAATACPSAHYLGSGGRAFCGG